MLNTDLFIFQDHMRKIESSGFSIVNKIYSAQELENIINKIDNADKTNETFRKSKDLFAIRQFLKEIPEFTSLIFNDQLKLLIKSIFGKSYFVVKSIYFDKPEQSNWYVAYHQDLTISVDQKLHLAGYGPWTIKQNQFAVQPPIDILKSIFTVRIHLDDTNFENGALKVIDKSHDKGIFRSENINWNIEKEIICDIEAGGIMIMKPMLLHGSNRSTNSKRRRVVHIEFCDLELPNELNWSEKLVF